MRIPRARSQAGESMQEIVQGVRRVSDLIGEITASTSEQRDGISQVNQAVAHLDQMTQQNAALVEEASAAAASMSEQARHLSDVVSVFNVGSTAASAHTSRTAPVRTSPPVNAAAKAVATPSPKAPAANVRQIATAPRKSARNPQTPKADTDDWESF